jgi:hypothetical protein
MKKELREKKERFDGIAIIDVDVSEFYSENGAVFTVNLIIKK